MIEDLRDLDQGRSQDYCSDFQSRPFGQPLTAQLSRMRNGIVTVSLAGDLRTGSLTDFKVQISQLLDEGFSDIIVDCQGLGFVCSSGLAALLWARTSATKSGNRLYLTHVPPALTEVLAITRLTKFLKIEPTTSGLLETLGDRPDASLASVKNSIGP